jgi:hypothetical protein
MDGRKSLRQMENVSKNAHEKDKSQNPISLYVMYVRNLKAEQPVKAPAPLSTVTNINKPSAG